MPFYKCIILDIHIYKLFCFFSLKSSHWNHSRILLHKKKSSKIPWAIWNHNIIISYTWFYNNIWMYIFYCTVKVRVICPFYQKLHLYTFSKQLIWNRFVKPNEILLCQHLHILYGVYLYQSIPIGTYGGITCKNVIQTEKPNFKQIFVYLHLYVNGCIIFQLNMYIYV